MAAYVKLPSRESSRIHPMNELYEVTKFVDHPMFEGFGLDRDAYP